MTTQSENLFNTWNSFQEQWWASWREAAAKTPQQDRPPAAPYMPWQELLGWSMKAQAEWNRLLMISALPRVGGGSSTVLWEEQLKMLMRFWTDAQRLTLDTWLKMATDLNTVTSSPAWTDAMKNMIESWLRLSQDVMDAQAKLLSSHERRQIRKQDGSGAKPKKAAIKDVG